MSILKKHVAHPVALLSAIATLASGLTCMTNPVASPKAHADELKPAYATAKIVKKADGTGHGTSSQTFLKFILLTCSRRLRRWIHPRLLWIRTATGGHGETMSTAH